MNDYFTLNSYKPVPAYNSKKKGLPPLVIIFLILMLSTLATLISYLVVSGKPFTVTGFNLSASLSKAIYPLSPNPVPYTNPFIEDQFSQNPFFMADQNFSDNLFDLFDTDLAVVNNRYENPF